MWRALHLQTNTVEPGRRTRAKNKTIEISNPDWRAAASKRWDAKRASLWGGIGGGGDGQIRRCCYRSVETETITQLLEILWCVVCWWMPLCAFRSLPGMHHAYDQTPPFPPPLHLIAFQLQTLISRCPHPRRAFILYCQRAVAVSSRLSTFEDVYPSGKPWRTCCPAAFRLCACIRMYFISAFSSRSFE